jgi:hypothetical protein
VKSGQYDDLEGDAHRILMDEDDPLLPESKLCKSKKEPGKTGQMWMMTKIKPYICLSFCRVGTAHQQALDQASKGGRCPPFMATYKK